MLVGRSFICSQRDTLGGYLPKAQNAASGVCCIMKHLQLVLELSKQLNSTTFKAEGHKQMDKNHVLSENKFVLPTNGDASRELCTAVLAQFLLPSERKLPQETSSVPDQVPFLGFRLRAIFSAIFSFTCFPFCKKGLSQLLAYSVFCIMCPMI